MRDPTMASRFSGRPIPLAPIGADAVAEIMISMARHEQRDSETGWLSRTIGRVADGVKPTKRAAWQPSYLRGKVTARPSGLSVSDGVAVLEIRGPIMDRAIEWDGYVYVDGYDRITAALDEARLDDTIRSVLIRFDTPGGMVDGIEDCSRAIRRVSDAGKPVHAHCSMALSAGFWLAAACDHISATPEGLVGSIGVVILHMEFSKALEDWGIKVTPIKFGAKKVDGNPFEPLSESAAADMQNMVDTLGIRFCTHVAERRGLEVDAVVALEAACLLIEAGKEAGLVDEIGFEEEAFAALAAQNRGESPENPAPAGAITTGKGATMALKDRLASLLKGSASDNALMKGLSALLADADKAKVKAKAKRAKAEEVEEDDAEAGAEEDEAEAGAEGDEAEAGAEDTDEEEDEDEDEDENAEPGAKATGTAAGFAIVGCPEAKGREKLAADLGRKVASKKLTYGEAKGLLAAAPKSGGRLGAAMADKDLNPGSGSGGDAKGAGLAAAVDRAVAKMPGAKKQ